MPKRYAVGVVNYQTYDDLARCLDAVKAQTLAPTEIVVVDADGDPARAEALTERHPEVRWLSRPNRGFGGGVNAAFAALGAPDSEDVDALLVLNPDVSLEPTYAEALLAEMRARPRVAIASGKLFRRNGDIDSAGIELPSHRRPFDRGSGRPDDGRFNETEPVFAVCGAAMMIRTSAISKLTVDGELFDEDFFAYREDTDLCWRAGRFGFEVLYVPEARATHGRRWRPSSLAARRLIPPAVRRHSFKNHYLQLIKNESPAALARNLPRCLAFELGRFGFALVFDPKVLPAYLSVLRHAPAAIAKRRAIDARLAPARRLRPAPREAGVSVPVAVSVHAAVSTREL